MENSPEKLLLKRRNFLTHAIKGTVAAVVGVSATSTGMYYYASNLEPSWFEVTHQQLRLPRLTKAFDGYRLVQITDIHSDYTFMTAERLSSIVQTVNTLQADLIVITGDFVTQYLPGLDGTLATLRHLRAKDGVLGVLGNHDHPAGVEWIRGILKTNQIQELDNKTHTITRGTEMLHIVGMDDLWPTNRGTPAPIWSHLSLLQQLTASLPSTGAAILLVHEPDFADVAAFNARCDLQLSGHSHGGQVCVPFYGPIKPVLPALSHNYPRGNYTIGKMMLYTNRGVGMLTPQVRFNCRPEIAVMDLYSQ
jgi:predicted MPP superfamily phosphohydrolase